MTNQPAPKTPAQIAYQAYSDATGGLTHDGRPMPAWYNLGDRIQHAWAAAALAISTQHDDDMPQPAYSEVWTELTGYVQEACEDGGTIAPQDLRDYLAELKRRALAPTTAWMKRIAEGPTA